MKTRKLIGSLLILGFAGSSSLLRAQSATPEQQQKDDHQQIEQLKQRVTEAERKLGAAGESGASEEAAATRNLTITGGADMKYQKADGEHGTFSVGHFSPVLLYRAGDRVLAESEVELEVAEDGEAEVGIEYAQIDYLFNDYVTFIIGRMLSPIGVVREKLDAAWINKLPIQPLPENGPTELIPENDVGVQARGAVPLTDPLRLTYAAYVVNGPGEDDATNMVFGLGADVNDRPSVGGRLALFYPWAAHQTIEVGVSGQTGPWDKDGNRQWSVAAVDAAVHLNEYTEFRGEYMKTSQETDTEGTLDREGWWAQAAYKLAGLDLDLPVVSDLEAVFRYSGLQLPDGHASQCTPGVNYYVNNTFIVKAAYAVGQGDAVDADGNSLDGNQFLFQVAYGF